MEVAQLAYKRGEKVYESLRNLDEVIGTQYGERVLYELLQNAHDAHPPGDHGRILVRLDIDAEDEGTLVVANDGTGFRDKDVEAVRNIAISAKEIGEGIGNKGLGFRSVEALTDSVEIYSRRDETRAAGFDGYCFRFAKADEVASMLQAEGADPAISAAVAATIPHYLVPVALDGYDEKVSRYAASGYATAVVASLRTKQAVDLAATQVEALGDLDVPLLLFLERIAEIRLEITRAGEESVVRRLRRRTSPVQDVSTLPGCSLSEVSIGAGRRFLVVRRELEKERVLRAVEESLDSAPQLKRWLDWKGTPVVSIAVPLALDANVKGRLYNFLPMGDEANSPLAGYLDAPFFADIDRRDVDLTIPLNGTLIEAAAEACAASALFIVDREVDLPQHVAFDLVAWSGNRQAEIDAAVKDLGTPLRDARLIPCMPTSDGEVWGSLAEVCVWPSAETSLLKAGNLAKTVDAKLVSDAFDPPRLERLKGLARRAALYDSLAPDDEAIAQWLEAFARALRERKAKPRTWSRFYEDVIRLFEATDGDLSALAHKEILLDNSNRLRAAGGWRDDAWSGLYVRNRERGRKRGRSEVPMPPRSIARRFRFLHDRITLRAESLRSFADAELVRTYDPIEALAGLEASLGARASDQRFEEALLWSYSVWRAAGSAVEEAVQEAGLRVPTLSGWYPASESTFSASWTTLGRDLEPFLFEAAAVSADCRYARERLLMPADRWPGGALDSKRKWTEFLTIVGVTDGLRPIPCQMRRSGQPYYYWVDFLQSGKAAEGFDADWCAEVANVDFAHPFTDYQANGEVWRLPGQLEHEEFPASAKEAFSTLVFAHFEEHGSERLHFEVGRFDRSPGERYTKRLPTPLGTFIRNRPWVAAATREGTEFRRPGECWAAPGRRGGTPGFVDRVPETARDLFASEDRTRLLFGETIGFRNWLDEETAPDRLDELAHVGPTLAPHERPVFRNEYRRAWLDLVNAAAEVPAECELAVLRRGQLETLRGDSESPPALVVVGDAHRFEARLLASAGRAILEVGDAPVQEVVSRIAETGAFAPQPLEAVAARLLVDDMPFAPSATDPHLASDRLAWLPELAVLANEICGERLERGIPSQSLDRKARAIRLRRCRDLSLGVTGDETDTAERLPVLAFEHDELPTLILHEGIALTWRTLALDLGAPVSRLLDSRLRAFERVLGRLAVELERPDDHALARALGCDLRTLEEHRLAMRTDSGRILDHLVPVVACFGDVDLAQRLTEDAARSSGDFDFEAWLREHLVGSPHPANELVTLCVECTGLAELRRRLDLDYAAFNERLVALGRLPLSNEEELRQQYEAYVARMRGDILERLRRHYLRDFRKTHDLAPYVERKSLAFLAFDEAWIRARETLDFSLVEAHVNRLLEVTLGDDPGGSLPSLKRTVDTNRKTVRVFAAGATPIVRAWCRKNGLTIPEPWSQDDPQLAAKRLEDAGLLDFEHVGAGHVASLFVRVGCWPAGMPVTIDHGALGLDEREVTEERERRENEQRQAEIAQRSIEFGGRRLDTADPGFAEHFEAIAEEALGRGDDWLQRSSRRVRLVESDADDSPPFKIPGGGPGGSRRRRQPPESQRIAMGVASEWLAYQYLQRRHPGYVDEACWISRNRARFVGGGDGDDNAGYDFLVTTETARWMYEVKSALDEGGEFELTANELRVAGSAAKDGRRRYRILYVPFVFDPDRWHVLELPNPMGETTRNRFQVVGRGSVRMRFERR